MKEIRSERDEMIDGIVEMLLHHVTVTDPHTITLLHDMQRSHFINMEDSMLHSVHERLTSYNAATRRSAALLLNTAERNLSASYSSWITGSGKSTLSDVVIRNCIFVVPVMEAAGIPVASITSDASKAMSFVAGEWENSSNEEFLGWSIWNAVDHDQKTLQSQEHLIWLGTNAEALIPYIPRLMELYTVERGVCEVFLKGHTSLSSGVL